MRMLTDAEVSALSPAEETALASPLPTQIVSSDEYLPAPQSEQRRGGAGPCAARLRAKLRARDLRSERLRAEAREVLDAVAM